MAQATYVPTGDTAFISGSVTITFPAERGTTRLSHPFSINSGGGKVCFAHGNLQYQASTGTWRFAEHQYDIIGNNPGNSVLTDATRSTQSDWIDMFSFGTSGWNGWVNDSNKIYQPWRYAETVTSVATLKSSLPSWSLVGNKQNADWAYYNAITSGESTDAPHIWRTLTRDEWEYVINGRDHASSLRGTARIYLTTTSEWRNGLVLLPDDFEYGVSHTFNNGANTWSSTLTSYETNSFDSEESWAAFEEAYDAVFLPAAGLYEDTNTNNWTVRVPDGRRKAEVNLYGAYWSTTYSGGSSYKSLYLSFKSNGINTASGTALVSGTLDGTARIDDRLAVRPVCLPFGPSATWSNCESVTLEQEDGNNWSIDVEKKYDYDCLIYWSDRSTNSEFTRDVEDIAGAPDLRAYLIYKKPIYADLTSLRGDVDGDRSDRGTVTVESIEGGTKRRITATPDAGYVFLRWSDGVVTNPRILTITEAFNGGVFTAYFAPASTLGKFTVDSHKFGWTCDSIIIRTESEDWEEIVGNVEAYFNNTGSAVKGRKANFDKGMYVLPTGDLSDKEGQTMDLVIFDKCGNVMTHTRGITIPKIVKTNANASTLGLSATSEVIVLPGVTLTFNTNVTIASLTVQAGAKVVINSDVTLTTGSLTMAADGRTGEAGIYPQMLVNGKIVKKGDTSNPVPLYLDYTLDYHKYYPLMLPYNVNIAGITFADGSSATIDEDYEVHRYNGAARASGVAGWENVGDDSPAATTLYATQGYDIFAAQEWKTGIYRDKSILRFPMLANLKDGEPAKALPVEQHPATNPHAANWNLIGNPYLGSFHNMNGGAVATSLIAEDGSGYRYINVPLDGFRDYLQTRVNDADVLPFNVFFVQAISDGDLTVSVGDRHLKAPARQNIQGEAINLPEELEAGITLTQGERYDRTGILLGNAFTEGYDYNADLAKMFGTAKKLNVYSISGNTQLAYCALPYAGNGTNVLPVLNIGYSNASTEETAVFAFDSKYYNAAAFDALYLTDNVTGETIDLLLDDYTFMPLAKQDDERFTLSAHVRRFKEITTGVDNTTTVTTNTESGVYDLLGRKVYNSVNAFRQMKQSVPAGIYIVIDNGQLTKEIIR